MTDEQMKNEHMGNQTGEINYRADDNLGRDGGQTSPAGAGAEEGTWRGPSPIPQRVEATEPALIERPVGSSLFTDTNEVAKGGGSAMSTSSSGKPTAPLVHDSPPPGPRPLMGMRRGLLGLVLTAALILGMLLGGAGAGAVMLVTGHTLTAAPPAAASTTQPTTSTTSTTPTTASEVLATSQTTNIINAIYQKVSPSVVRISVVIQTRGRFRASGEAVGTGMIIDTQGHILTNYHIIEGASSIRVELSDGSEYPANVTGTAPQDDLAVIQINAPTNKLVPISLGDSSTVQVGDEVIAIGYPYGLEQSVTEGIVSGLNREGTGSNGGRTLTGLIQTDAAINPGNSGGPLLNAQGQVIGVNTMIESPVDAFTGVGLAIPINHAKEVLSQLVQGSGVQRPWLGITGTDITSSLQNEYNLPVNKGILVISVVANSPAAEAGLQGSTMADTQNPLSGTEGQISQIGDIIVAIDGHSVGSIADLTSYLNGKQPGDKVTLTIIRNTQRMDISVTLQAWPQDTGGNTGASTVS